MVDTIRKPNKKVILETIEIAKKAVQRAHEQVERSKLLHQTARSIINEIHQRHP